MSHANVLAVLMSDIYLLLSHRILRKTPPARPGSPAAQRRHARHHILTPPPPFLSDLLNPTPFFWRSNVNTCITITVTLIFSSTVGHCLKYQDDFQRDGNVGKRDLYLYRKLLTHYSFFSFIFPRNVQYFTDGILRIQYSIYCTSIWGKYDAV